MPGLRPRSAGFWVSRTGTGKKKSADQLLI